MWLLWPQLPTYLSACSPYFLLVVFPGLGLGLRYTWVWVPVIYPLGGPRKYFEPWSLTGKIIPPVALSPGGEEEPR